MRIKDRVAIVTGAGGRIGRGISTRLAEEGARVVVVDVNLETAEETVDLIKKNDGEAVALKVDVTQKAEIQSMADKVLESYGQIDILVNNAGMDHKEPIVEYDEDWWDKLFALNVKGLFLLRRQSCPR